MSSRAKPRDLLNMIKQYFVYFVTNWTGNVLYTGMTSDIEKRIFEHKNKLHRGFTQKYNLNHLVYFEEFSDPVNAIQREKQIKNWSREKKNKLVEAINPNWNDLSLAWYDDPSASLGMTIREEEHNYDHRD